MTNLPPELGRAIFKQILSPKTWEAKCRELEKEMIEVRKREKALYGKAEIKSIT